MKGNTKSNKGITLVALVITIIVLLILAAVTIKLVIDGGIMQHADTAASKYSQAQEEEKVNLAVADAKMAANGGAINYANLNTALNSQFPDGVDWVSTAAPFSFTVVNGTGETYTINENGDVTPGEFVPEEMTDEEKTAWDAQTNEAYFIWDSAGTTITGYASTTLPETLIIPTKCTAITTSLAAEGTPASNLTSIKTVKIPSSVKTLDHAFTNFTGLTTVEFTKPTITEIGPYAFRGCTSLESFSIPGTVTKLGEEAFLGTPKLTSIIIPNSVTELGRSVFANPFTSMGTGLQDITMSNNVVKCGENILDNTAWIQSQENGPVYLGSVFLGYKGDFPQNYELEIRPGTKTFASLRIGWSSGANIKKITIPNSIVYIASYAFSECRNYCSIVIESGSPLSTSSENYNWGLNGWGYSDGTTQGTPSIIQWP